MISKGIIRIDSSGVSSVCKTCAPFPYSIAICWPRSDTGWEELRGVLNAGDAGFSFVSDPESEIAAAIKGLGRGIHTTGERD